MWKGDRALQPYLYLPNRHWLNLRISRQVFMGLDRTVAKKRASDVALEEVALLLTNSLTFPSSCETTSLPLPQLCGVS